MICYRRITCEREKKKELKINELERQGKEEKERMDMVLKAERFIEYLSKDSGATKNNKLKKKYYKENYDIELD